MNNLHESELQFINKLGSIGINWLAARVNAPTAGELNTLVAKMCQRVARHPERQGLLVRDDESSHLTQDLQDDDAMSQLQRHSITYRIAVGPQQGRKLFTLQTIPSWEEDAILSGVRSDFARS